MQHSARALRSLALSLQIPIVCSLDACSTVHTFCAIFNATFFFFFFVHLGVTIAVLWQAERERKLKKRFLCVNKLTV